MSYINRSLGQGERVIAVAHFHWLYQLGAVLALVVLGWILIGIWIFLHMTIRYHTTEIGITTHRFILKTGLFTLHTQEMALNNIEGVQGEPEHPWSHLQLWGAQDRRHRRRRDRCSRNMIADPVGFRRAIESAKEINVKRTLRRPTRRNAALMLTI